MNVFIAKHYIFKMRSMLNGYFFIFWGVKASTTVVIACGTVGDGTVSLNTWMYFGRIF